MAQNVHGQRLRGRSGNLAAGLLATCAPAPAPPPATAGSRVSGVGLGLLLLLLLRLLLLLLLRLLLWLVGLWVLVRPPRAVGVPVLLQRRGNVRRLRDL
jgi:hypothetical protein